MKSRLFDNKVRQFDRSIFGVKEPGISIDFGFERSFVADKNCRTGDNEPKPGRIRTFQINIKINFVYFK